MCNLHWCYTFCTDVTLFALVLHFNCTALSQSESSNFFMCIINLLIITLSLLHDGLQIKWARFKPWSGKLCVLGQDFTSSVCVSIGKWLLANLMLGVTLQ